MDTELRWSLGSLRSDPRAALLEAAVEVCWPAGQAAGPAGPADTTAAGIASALAAGTAGAAGGTIEVDSSAFFFAGRKAGYGSSAAAAVAICWALLALTEGAPPKGAGVLEAARAAHRRAQGGKGSGYDVLASFHGGVGLFTGGRHPSWQPLELPWLEPLYLFHGERSLSTPGAIERYFDWRRREPGQAKRFLEESNRQVQGFTRAASRQEALGCLRRCRELSLRLGEAIGVPAELAPPGGGRDERVPAEDCKALGAGNELGLAFPVTPLDHPAGLRPVRLAASGLRQEGRAWAG
jgi:phosphomevalonate kinase